MHLDRIVFVFYLSILTSYADDEMKFTNNGRNYNIYLEDVSFYSAQSKCAQKNQDLIAIENEEVSNWITKEVMDNIKGDLWIGMYRQGERENEPHWHWVATGKDAEFKNWCPVEETQNWPNEFCALIYYGASGCWQDWSCFTPVKGYACQDKTVSKTEEPKAEEPKAEEPQAEEPKAEEPKAEEPQAEEPKAEEPQAEEPKAEEPQAEEPKKEEPKTGEHKNCKKPEVLEEVCNIINNIRSLKKLLEEDKEPEAEKPKAEEPPAGEPKAEEPQAEEPKAEEPQAEEPKAEEPKAEEPKAEEPQAEEPKAEEPQAVEPKAEEPQAEEPKAEEPQAEEPKAEEPQAEEPKAEE